MFDLLCVFFKIRIKKEQVLKLAQRIDFLFTVCLYKETHGLYIQYNPVRKLLTNTFPRSVFADATLQLKTR